MEREKEREKERDYSLTVAHIISRLCGEREREIGERNHSLTVVLAS